MPCIRKKMLRPQIAAPFDITARFRILSGLNGIASIARFL